MYLDYYGIDKEPFHITPDPEFLFLSTSHKEALGAMIYGVQQRKGFLAVTGEVGLGKTTVLRAFIENLDEAHVKTVIVFNANVSYKGLLKTIYRDLGLELSNDDVFEMVNGLHEALIEEYKADRNVVLIIDEAQNMPVETLENLRMLSNLETSKDKLLQILLIGQPELEAILDRPELRQLKQRLAVRARLEPLTADDSLKYIEQRLRKAGGESGEIFTKGALQTIVHEAKGVPRRINIICDNALVTGFGYNEKPVTKKIVLEVIGDLEGRGGDLRRRFKWAALLVVIAGFLATLLWMGSGALGDFMKTAGKAPDPNSGASISPMKRSSQQDPPLPQSLQSVQESGGLVRKFPVSAKGADSGSSPTVDPGSDTVEESPLQGDFNIDGSALSPESFPPAHQREEPSFPGGLELEESSSAEGLIAGEGPQVTRGLTTSVEEDKSESAEEKASSQPASQEFQRLPRDPGDAIELLLQRRMEEQP